MIADPIGLVSNLFACFCLISQLTCDRGTRGGTADRRTVTFDCTGTIPRGSSATSTLNWSRFLQPASRFSNARLTVNSPTPVSSTGTIFASWHAHESSWCLLLLLRLLRSASSL